jgi:tetratricopeptide (TPR) repeat protein
MHSASTAHGDRPSWAAIVTAGEPARSPEPPLATAAFLRNPVIVRVVLLALVTAALLAGVHALVRHSQPVPAASAHRRPSHGAPLDYAQALALANQSLAGGQELARTRADEWLVQEKIANAWMSRARLTGSFDDYAAAQAALDVAFAYAPPGSGPQITQAVLAFSLHRLAPTAAALDVIDHYAVPPEFEIAEEANAMHGDVAFYSGRYAEALARYRGRKPSDKSSFRMAVYQAKTGQTDAALATLDAMERAMRFPTAQVMANLDLQRGGLELQRGRWDAAAADFARADAIFPGFWLTEAHRAQMRALTGDRAGAIAAFEAIATRITSPEVMDALASLYRAEGDGARSALWAERAGAEWERRLKLLPEAAYGHAVEHYLAFGDPKRALDLALKDAAARPYGTSQIALGWAWLANNRPAEALRALAPLQGSPWVSAEQHLVAAQAHALLGDGDAADAEQQKALALNPRALDRAGALIWFGHT